MQKCKICNPGQKRETSRKSRCGSGEVSIDVINSATRTLGRKFDMAILLEVTYTYYVINGSSVGPCYNINNGRCREFEEILCLVWSKEVGVLCAVKLRNKVR